ncbi:MAG: hypothetical protein SCM96_00330 [Acidobacteriota bacterium]|nr:hypothetical protein [Acidobacteriota bacterium]
MPCPEDCDHFRKHTPYQDAKARPAESFEDADRVLQDDRLMWLVFHIETALHQVAAGDLSFADGAAIQALEWALAETGKDRRLVLLPGEFDGPVDPAGQALLDAVEACWFSKSVILETEGEGYSREDKILCLKFLLQGGRHLSKGRRDGRAFLDFLADRMDRLKDPQI